MNKKIILSYIGALLFLMLPIGIAAQDRGFVHPGILHTQADFDRIKKQLAEGDPVVTAGYKKLTDNWLANKWDGQWGPTEYIVRGGTSGQNYMSATNDGAMAYLFALRYKITDDSKYADRAIRILNSYPSVTKGIGGDTNGSLASGFIGYYFANAAELLRDYEGWVPKDFKAFQQFMLDIFFARAQDFLQNRHGTCNSHYQSNWGACNILTLISIGILCDDPAIYNYGMWFLKQGDGNESISLSYCGNGGGIIPFFHEDARGSYGYLNQMQESTRDQPHCMGALGMLECSAEVGWNQGDNIWNSNNNIIAGAIEYVAAWNTYDETTEKDLLDNFPSTGWSGCGAEGWQPNVSWSGRGGLRPIWQIGVNHFSNRMGKPMTFAKKAKAMMGVEGGPGDYGSNSGGYDNVGFGDLMYNEEPATAIPTVLRPRIVYKDNNNDYAEISKVEKGSTLTLQALLPDGEENTGNWEWDNGETTPIRTITADRSMLYRVTYTNAQGAKSRQLFSVAVYGDCVNSSINPSYTYNGRTVNDTLVEIPKGASLTLSVAPKAWAYDNTIKWATGETSSSISISNIRSARTYWVTVTNRNGKVNRYTFHIDITDIASYMQCNGTTTTESYAQVAEGTNVKLWGTPVASATGGSFKWNDGSTGDTLKLNQIQEGGIFTLIYTSPAGKESKTSWQIDVFNKNKLTEGEYFLLDASTGLYYTNPCTEYGTDKSEVMTFNDLQEDALDTQIWKFALDASSNRYKITSKKDGRFLNEFGVIRNRAYYASWNSCEVYHLTGTDLYAFQNGGDAGKDYWIINDQNGINGKGSATMPQFPFKLIPADGRGLNEVTTTQVQFWQNDISDEISLTTATEGTLYLISTDGMPLRRFHCTEGINNFSISDLPQGFYLGIIDTPLGKASIKIIKK